MESISVGMVPNEIHALIYLAYDQQYFSANGLNVNIKDYTSGLTSVNGVLNGEVDIAVASEFIVVGKGLSSASISIFGTIAKAFDEYVVAKASSGISIISDLKGKKIGVSLGTSTEFYLGKFLEMNGMNLTQVTPVNVPPSQTPNALVNGTVDAVIAWQPNINTIENLLGNDTVKWPAQSGQALYDNAICTDNWAAMHPELIMRFLTSIAQAESFAINNPSKAKIIIQNRLNYSDSYVAAIWPENQFFLSLDQSLLVSMENEARWMISNNLSNQTVIPDFLNYIYLEGLISVKPESVNIIRWGQ
jgi:ABC-type nitrate/sulfonate/bicarbonate transport system substrate-binding protein